MGYHPRIESSDIASLGTVRSRNSELWLINNRGLESAILGYLAKYASRHELKLYAFAIEGSHCHSLAHFPKENRAAFHRDFNASVARAVPRYVPKYPGGRFWGRRYSAEFVPGNEDIEEYFFYLALQPVQDGLVDKISDYPGYNFFNDAVSGIERKFEVINWAAYNERKRWSERVRIKDYKITVTLKFERLPGYAELSQKDYRELMHRKLEARRLEIIERRNRPCLGPDRVRRLTPGIRAKKPKLSNVSTHRPRILSICPVRRHEFKRWYFEIYFWYKEASILFRRGNLDTEFPPGTYRPPPSSVVYKPAA